MKLWTRVRLAAGLAALVALLGASAARSQELIERLPPVEAAPIETMPDLSYCETLPSVCPPSNCWYRVNGLARSYYINDQRIEFTGVEATFAVEGVAEGTLYHQVGEWDVQTFGQLFLTQPFDRNILVDSPTRASFANNFDIDIATISQLYLSARRNDLYFAAGKFVQPFGRFYYPLYRNNFDDSPFIRSEAIGYRETGLLAQWDPGNMVFTAALTNGGLNQDANSSKAFVGRWGVDYENFSLGNSVKFQDGIGSEGQKIYNSQAGLDVMYRRGNWSLSGEVIYDQYGTRRPVADLNNITWGRSLYFRDINKGFNKPIYGVGYYVNLQYDGPQWTLVANYGEFYPEHVGDPRHDVAIHRGLLKASRHWTKHLETYGVLMLENSLANIFDGHARRGVYLIAGAQIVF